MLSVENEATPWTAGTVTVPESTPPTGFDAMASVTFPVKLVTVLPSGSRADTMMVGAMAVPAVALDGCTVKPRVVAPLAVMVNGVLLAPVRPPDDADSV